MLKYLFLIIMFTCSYSSLADDLNIVYRATMESPQTLKAQGGFHPRGMDGTRPNQPPPNINLWDHVRGTPTGMSRHDSGYVSTTSSRSFAINFIYDYLNYNGYVYHIRPTPNFIDVNGTLGGYSPHSGEYEYAAMGTIHWEQVIGWERVGSTIERFVRNPDYNERIYGNLSSSGVQPQLAGFPPTHPAWRYQPWINFANCELRASCTPNQTVQQVGNEWYWETYRSPHSILIAASEWQNSYKGSLWKKIIFTSLIN